jgi:hypothetical protein
MTAHPARRLWATLETLHAVTYFAPGVGDAGRAIGLKGFWQTYFAFRAAPLGAVGPEAVVAIFAGFHPNMVSRALPAAWERAEPGQCLEMRLSVSAASLRQAGVTDDMVGAAVGPLSGAVVRLDLTGRPLGAANVAVARGQTPVEQLWQLATVVREYRGDGHVAALVGAGVSGVEAHLLQAPTKGLPAEAIRQARGLSANDWAAAGVALSERGLLAGTGITPAGRDLLHRVEDDTDRFLWSGGLATGLGEDGVVDVVDRLRPAVEAVVATGWLPFPNPMGSPDPREA